MELHTHSFGAHLAQLRRQAGLSQQELAQRLSVTRQAVSNWERNQTVPDLEMLRTMADTLEVDLNTLCAGPAARPVRSRRAPLMMAALALFLCGAFALGSGLWLWYGRSAPDTADGQTQAPAESPLPAHRVRYTTPDGTTVITAADGALEVSQTLSALPEQQPGAVALTGELRENFSYFARQYVLRFLPDWQDGAFCSDWDEVLLWCYRSGCSGGDIMQPQVVADYLERFFAYEGDLPEEGTAQFPLKSGGYYPQCGAFTTAEDRYTLTSLELLQDGSYAAALEVQPYNMTLALHLVPTEDGVCILSALKSCPT